MEGLREVSQEGVVRQRHPSPLFERQVHSGIQRSLFRYARGIGSGREAAARLRFRGTADGNHQAGHLRPRSLSGTGESSSRSRPAEEFGDELLRRGIAARGGGILRTHGQTGRPAADFLRSQLTARQAERKIYGTCLEDRRHVCARPREDSLLARKGRRSGLPRPKGNDRGAHLVL